MLLTPIPTRPRRLRAVDEMGVAVRKKPAAEPAVQEPQIADGQNGQPATERFVLRLFLNETLSVRVECDLKADAFSRLADSPLLKHIAIEAIKRIVSEFQQKPGDHRD